MDSTPDFTRRFWVGRCGVIVGPVAAGRTGQAEFLGKKGRALLTVRADVPLDLPFGTQVRIIDFDPARAVYTVVVL